MKSNLLMDFTVDKINNLVNVTREFNAGNDLVWAAWTESELLDQWWAPQPYQSRTKRMNFEVGGQRLYAMVGPEGEEHWALADYTSITPKSNFKYLDAFCDENGKINEAFPRSDWDVDFKENNGVTTVYVSIKHDRLEDLEKIIEMGFKEGFTIALDGLDDLFKTI